MAIKSRYATPNKYAQSNGNGEWLKITLLVVFIVSLLGGVGYYLYTKPKSVDKASLCPAEGPLGHVVVLVDNTDPYSFIQRQGFVQALGALTDQVVPEGYLLSVFALGEDYQKNAEPIFEKCNPGTSDGKSELTANLKRIDKRFNESFREPVLQLEDVLMAQEPAKYSPVFEMIQLASIKGFRAHKVKGPKKLIIFSDMLPNTESFSMFKGVPEFKAFSATVYGEHSKTDLSGIKVELHYLMKYPKLQTMKQLKFWEDYFENTGARLTRVQTMEG